jgi:hypothetical protein
MTIQIDTADPAARHLDKRSAIVVAIYPPNRTHHASATQQRLGAIFHATAAALGACWGGLLAGLHESRRRQAAIERARYRHLIYDAETGVSFVTNTTGQNPAARKTVLPLAGDAQRR